MASKMTKPNSEIQTAKDWYFWLWLSPVLTIPTLLVLLMVVSFSAGTNEMSPWIFPLVAVLGSALWHMILLIPAIGGKTEFVRWHGRQALLLAGARTALALATALIFSLREDGFSLLLGFLLLVILWLGGNIWGLSQAKRGDCALMRWSGHGDGLTLPVAQTPEPPKQPPTPVEIDQLVGIIRFNSNPEQRLAALAQLERLGLVESL